ncbi:MAG: tRNA lysidine(34) synthetase TilS, partial [Anaerolineales bacterium]|nr:tRNA lysidine(34) synthetase TilS [Anaerolineales bacterium]
HVLCSILPAEQLLVAHLNHGLRSAAATDAAFVQTTAQAWGVRCVVEVVDVAALAKQKGVSLEEAGRQARYQFFARLARQEEATAVAVAHNADDQAETVLLHVLRGSGLLGLRGMRPISPMPQGDGVWLLRPFLAISRAEIEAYCQENQLHPVEDASNQELIFLRNRLRHELLPLLAAYNPAIKTRLQHMADIVAADYDLLDAIVTETWEQVYYGAGDGWLAWRRSSWRDLPLSLRRALLRKAIFQLEPQLADVTFRVIESARQVAETKVAQAAAALPGGLVLRALYDLIYVIRETAVLPVSGPQLEGERELPVPGTIQLADGWQLVAELQTASAVPDVQHNEDPWHAFVDVGEAAVLQVRSRLPGERWQPLGMGGHSTKVKEVMINRRIPVQLREKWPLVVADEHLVWMVGQQIDERVKVTAVTQRIVHLYCYQKFRAVSQI